MVNLSEQIATRTRELSGESAFEVLAKAKALEAKGKKIVHLEIGQPDFPTPAHITEAAIAAMKDGWTGYSLTLGLPELREEIADYISITRDTEVSSDRVIVAPGAKPLLFFTILALVNPGDEVICPDPGFPTYRSCIEFAGGIPVSLPLVEAEKFRFRMEDLENAISEKTKLLIINSPHNPTGGFLLPGDLEAIANLAKQHNFYILSDEIYSRLLYDRKHYSILSFPEMAERTILVDGFSKTYSMTGWRLGYAVAPEHIMPQLELLMLNSNSCTCTFIQKAGVAALQGSQYCVKEMIESFRYRRDLLVAGINQIPGVSCLTPPGAFYIFPNVKSFGLSSQEIADYLLNNAGVALLSGRSFGNCGEGYLRLSYATSVDNIQKALERLNKGFSQLSQMGS
ncbi:pyridoxal phosphate-dependent aminotransferase [Roseofilum casamattae]|uniref:Aminotransferase n=1 Tax=Roseofilum casamattae BLCC-M143 TaxID=3022442 RepID=A0ABT7BRX9_9CYAN|nr:pyridoxal phosphate-dependent aminotransferase [Roseofilum casamattae]MDJ1181948.1 pyridoxal phosphate-dependent aminotransferase [Roseofilum casamattae BLCC-M143]